MSQSDQFDNFNNEGNEINKVSDTYTAESSADIYNTPDISSDSLRETPVNEAVNGEKIAEAQETTEADTAFTETTMAATDGTAPNQPYGGQTIPNDNPYGGQTIPNDNPYGGQSVPNDNLYSGQSVPNDNPYEGQIVPNDNPYGGQVAPNDNPYSRQTIPNDNPYGGQVVPNDNPYGGQTIPNDNPYGGQSVPNDNPYSGQSVANNNPYGWQAAPDGNSYGGQNMTNNNLYGGQPVQTSRYYSDPNANNPYVGQNTTNSNLYEGQPTTNNDSYNSNQYGSNSYNGQTIQGDNQYGNSQFNNNQYGVPPYGNNQYSPYAVPQKKSNTGLIIGIVVAVIILFLIAFGALTYKVVTLYSEEKDNGRNAREEYNFDDDWDKDQNHRYEDQYDDDYDDDYGGHGYDDDGYDGYDDDYGYDDYNYDDDEYYTLHDDIKTDLSYSVEFDYYEYDSDYENVDIMVFYPVISNSTREGKDIPNLDKINSTIYSEVDFLVEYFEDEYEEYFVDDGDSYFQATSSGYVTYMDEEKMSIVFSETVYSDYYYDAFLYSINIDMENGVILDNESILNIDDDFSVEFRQKSDIQNGEISHLTMMSDQEITGHFNSSDIIVFYTPQGMEIGFNYDEGWVTVTYKEYEQYLKVF